MTHIHIKYIMEDRSWYITIPHQSYMHCHDTLGKMFLGKSEHIILKLDIYVTKALALPGMSCTNNS